MKVGDRVRLVRVDGTKQWNGRGKVYEPENYWKLIGETGTIVQDPTERTLYASFSKKPRVAVQSDSSVNGRGLICHNPVPNSLWILVTDLEIIRRAHGSQEGE